MRDITIFPVIDNDEILASLNESALGGPDGAALRAVDRPPHDLHGGKYAHPSPVMPPDPFILGLNPRVRPPSTHRPNG